MHVAPFVQNFLLNFGFDIKVHLTIYHQYVHRHICGYTYNVIMKLFYMCENFDAKWAILKYLCIQMSISCVFICNVNMFVYVNYWFCITIITLVITFIVVWVYVYCTTYTNGFIKFILWYQSSHCIYNSFYFTLYVYVLYMCACLVIHPL